MADFISARGYTSKSSDHHAWASRSHPRRRSLSWRGCLRAAQDSRRDSASDSWTCRTDEARRRRDSQAILHPTITFDEQLWLELGDRQLHLFPTPGHSPDIVSIYISDCRLLVASDTVVTGIVPAIFHSSAALEASINRAQKTGYRNVDFGSWAGAAWASSCSGLAELANHVHKCRAKRRYEHDRGWRARPRGHIGVDWLRRVYRRPAAKGQAWHAQASSQCCREDRG